METALVLLLVLAAVAYLFRGLLKTERGCASGCGSCGNSKCALRRLEEAAKKHPHS